MIYNRNAVPRGFEVADAFKNCFVQLPERSTSASAGYDIRAFEDADIPPHTMVTIHSGIKAFMQSDEVLKIYPRSSIGIKHGIILGNSVSIIDADYYQTGKDILLCFYNLSDKTYHIYRNDRVAQGIFQKYLTCGDEPDGVRTGGLGSTGDK